MMYGEGAECFKLCSISTCPKAVRPRPPAQRPYQHNSIIKRRKGRNKLLCWKKNQNIIKKTFNLLVSWGMVTHQNNPAIITRRQNNPASI